jgi:hypothetical protein
VFFVVHDFGAGGVVAGDGDLERNPTLRRLQRGVMEVTESSDGFGRGSSGNC